MKNVLHIRSSFDAGGTETLLLHLFNYKQNYFNIHLALIKDGRLIKDLSNSENHYYKFFRKRFFDLFVIRKLYQVIKTNSISIIHTHQVIELFYAVMLKLKKPDIKIFHSVHLLNFERNWTSYLESFLVNFAEKIIAVSQTVKDHLIAKGYASDKIIVIPNAVSLPEKVNHNDIIKFKEKINYSRENFVVLMIGNFREEKDQLTLLKAFNLLRNDYPQIKLVFIGKDNEFAEPCKKMTLEEDFNTRVFYVGELENASKYIPCCDVFVYSTKSETFGIAVVEALLQKKPVIASDIDAMIELSKNGKYFTLFATGNDKDLAEKIKHYIDNGINPEKTKKSYQYAVNNFSYEKFIKNLSNIYFQ